MKRLLAFALVALLMASLASATGLTVTQLKVEPMGTWKVATAAVLFDSIYPTGGEALTAATLGLTKIDFVMVTPDSTGAAGYNFGYASAKLWCGGLENTLAIDPASFDVAASGAAETLAINVPSTNGAIAFEEMDAGTDLSAVKVRVMAFGK